jgi:hypothetical protein
MVNEMMADNKNGIADEKIVSIINVAGACEVYVILSIS